MCASSPSDLPAAPPPFGRRLRDLRESIHLTQKQAAALFHTSEDNYAHYEHSRRVPDRDRVVEFLRNFRRQYPSILTEATAGGLLAAYDPARPVNPTEWESIFGPPAAPRATDGGPAGPSLPTAAPPGRRLQLFLAYAPDLAPDGALARQVAGALSRDHAVSSALAEPGGARWAQHLEQELRAADCLLVFLSAGAIRSEVLLAVLDQAARLAQVHGRPVILPVRLAYTGPLPYPLNTALSARRGFTWQAPVDTPALVADLRLALHAEAGGRPVSASPTGGGTWGALSPPVGTPSARSAGDDAALTPLHLAAEDCADGTAPALFGPPAPVAQPAGLEMPEGTMDPQSAFYVERPSDLRAQSAIRQQGVTITIKGPRQMGKSSLLYRTIAAAHAAGKRVVLLDFQLFDAAALAHADLFLRQFCAGLSDELGLPERVDEYWRLPVSNIQRCTNYLKKYLLPQLDRPLVLAMDEVDRIFDTEYRSDFFGMLRNWHNMRQATVGLGATGGLWKRLDLVLVTSTEPYQFVANLNQSPFNVGQVIDLEDLTAAQVADLNRRYGSPLTSAEEGRLMALLGGQPYLVRRALYLVAAGLTPAADLFVAATADAGPFADHLRYHLVRLYEKPELLAGLQGIIRTHTCPDERLFFRLRGAGLVRREGAAVVPRYALYADYFREQLRG